MPYADPAKQAAFLAKYYRENRGKMRLLARERRQKNLAKERALAEKKNRAKGHKPRATGPRAKTRVQVPQGRRVIILEGRAFFNSQLGFTRAELLTISAQLPEEEPKS